MRKVFRYEDNREYWDRRWFETKQDRDQFVDKNIYPIMYAEMVMKNESLRAVEFGSRLGKGAEALSLFKL